MTRILNKANAANVRYGSLLAYDIDSLEMLSLAVQDAEELSSHSFDAWSLYKRLQNLYMVACEAA